MDPSELEEIAGFVEIGSVLAGKYRIERLIGVGGMGAIVAARHLALDETVAIKLMLPKALGKRRQSARFLLEARAASRLRSAHVARVFDVDQRADGTPFIVMEYLTGETVAARFERGRQPVVELVDGMLEACEALAEAHSLGVIHRDLKPANLFLAHGAGNAVSLKVLDFGISKHVFDSAGIGDATTGDGLLGSPPYMSPEQFTNPSNLDHRTDVWSLGVILYEGLSGERPFAGGSLAEVCAQVLQSRPPALGSLAPGLPASLVACVDRCLEKGPEARWPNVAMLAGALAAHGSERGRRVMSVIESVPMPGVGGAAAEILPEPKLRSSSLGNTGTLTAATARSDGPPGAGSVPASKKGTLWAAAVVVCLAVVGWFGLRGGRAPEATGEPTVEPSAGSRAEPFVTSQDPSTTAPSPGKPFGVEPEPSATPPQGAPVPHAGEPRTLPATLRKQTSSKPVPASASRARPPAQVRPHRPPAAPSGHTFDPVFDERR